MVNLVGRERGRLENEIFPLFGVVEMRGMKNGWVEFPLRPTKNHPPKLRGKSGEKIVL